MGRVLNAAVVNSAVYQAISSRPARLCCQRRLKTFVLQLVNLRRKQSILSIESVRKKGVNLSLDL